jgi:hypothetical protein
LKRGGRGVEKKMECRKDLIFYVINLSICVISLGTAFHLAYREKDKVRFEYIGPLISEKAIAIAVIKKIEQRKDFEHKIKQIKNDLTEIEKVINGRKI